MILISFRIFSFCFTCLTLILLSSEKLQCGHLKWTTKSDFLEFFLSKTFFDFSSETCSDFSSGSFKAGDVNFAGTFFKSFSDDKTIRLTSGRFEMIRPIFGWVDDSKRRNSAAKTEVVDLKPNLEVENIFKKKNEKKCFSKFF